MAGPVCKKEDCISLYDVAILMKSKYDELENSKKYYDKELDCLLKSELGSIHCCLYNFNYDTNELKIGIKDFTSYNYEDIVFTKKDGDLVIVSSNYWNANEILACIGNQISIIYDKLLEFKYFEEQHNYGFHSANSSFFVDIGKCGVSILNEDFDGDFELSLYSCDNEWHYKCSSNDIINVLKNKENEIFKRIFVKIDDCPEWARAQLYVKRQDELTEYRRAENERKILEQKAKEKEMKRVRRREFAKKFFPFIKY